MSVTHTCGAACDEGAILEDHGPGRELQKRETVALVPTPGEGMCRFDLNMATKNYFIQNMFPKPLEVLRKRVLNGPNWV